MPEYYVIVLHSFQPNVKEEEYFRACDSEG